MADRTRRRLRTASLLLAAPALAFACGPGGGGGTGGTGGGGTAGAGGTSGAAGAAGFAGSTAGTAGTSTGGQSGAAGGPADASTGGSAGSAGAAGSGTGGTGGAVSLVCGDGIRGLDEECDDGNASNDDACTTDCYVTDFLAVGLGPLDAGVPLPGRYLGAGRHPVAAGADGFAVAHIAPTPSPHVGLSAFGPSGEAIAPNVLVSAGSTALLFSDPVLAALPGGTYAAAWTDFNGDGDELGVALRIVDPLIPPSGAPAHANTTTDFSQLDPDILWTGTELIVAWVDDSSATTGPDIRYRSFSSTLVPSTVTEQTLSADPGTDSAVSLSTFAGSWAAAWRHVEAGGAESIRVRAGTTSWTVGPHAPGSPDDKPALVELDASTLLLVFAEGVALRGSILDLAAPGTVAAFSLVPIGSTLAQSHANAVIVGSRIFIAWRTGLEPGNPLAEETWLREVSFSGGSLTLGDPFPLPRWVAHQDDDQRFPALAASPLAPEGALVTAWDDYGLVFGAGEGAPDVVVELIPTPVLRKPPPGGGS